MLARHLMDYILPSRHICSKLPKWYPQSHLYGKITLGTWEPQRDLLSSDEFTAEFVVETETDGTSYIRFDNRDRQDWADQIESSNRQARGASNFSQVHSIV